MKTYWVVNVSAGDTLESAKDWDDKVSTIWNNHYDALFEWLSAADSNSNFVDGYPDRWRYDVVDCETEETKTFEVGTDFIPEFHSVEIIKNV